MKKCFKFAKENSSSLGVVYRPIVKVGLIDADGDLFELSMLVDSGADISDVMLSPRIVSCQFCLSRKKTGRNILSFAGVLNDDTNAYKLRYHRQI